MTRTIFLPRKNVLLTAVSILWLAFLLPCKSNAQNRHILNNASFFKIETYDVLPDANYSLERVVNDSTLRFRADSLRPSVSDYYWVKITIENPYPNDEPYILSLSRPLYYALYQYKPGSTTEIALNRDKYVSSQYRKGGLLKCVLQKQAANVLYFKIGLRNIKRYGVATKPAITLQKEMVFAAGEQSVILSTIICCIVLLSFCAYNLYIYFQLKDRTYLYYVLVQIGALLYLLAIRFLFGNISDAVYNIKVYPNGSMIFFDINGVVMHVGVTIIFCGFLQFTRSYLCTKEFLPVYDRVLKLLSYGYIVLEAVPVIITASGLYYLNAIAISNIYILVIATACMVTAVVAHNRKLMAARYFIAANLLPISFTVITSVAILLHGGAVSSLLPEIAILSQILTFAVAMVARVKLINEELKAKEIEAIQLENDIKLKEVKRLLIEEENKNITLTMQLEKEKNEQLQQKLEANQRELVGNSLYIHQKNKLLSDLKMQMEDIDTLYPNASPETLKNIQSSLKEGLHLDDEWDKFKVHFEQVHPSFFNELQVAHPNLTKYEQRLYAYFHINMSTKEIGTLLNIAPASVRQAKARLNKKMGKGGD